MGEALFNLDLNSGAYSCARCHTQGWSYGEPGGARAGRVRLEPHRRLDGVALPERAGHDQLRQGRLGDRASATASSRRAPGACRPSATCSPTSRSRPSSNTCGACDARRCSPINWEPRAPRHPHHRSSRSCVLWAACYLILGTNLGARLGFLVAFAALAGWMFLMGAIWWSYGKGLLGPDAVVGADQRAHGAADHGGASTTPARSTTRSSSAPTPTRRRRADGGRRAVRDGRLEEARLRRCRRTSRPVPRPARCSRSRRPWPAASSRSSTCSTRVASARRSRSARSSTSSPSSTSRTTRSSRWRRWCKQRDRTRSSTGQAGDRHHTRRISTCT